MVDLKAWFGAVMRAALRSSWLLLDARSADAMVATSHSLKVDLEVAFASRVLPVARTTAAG